MLVAIGGALSLNGYVYESCDDGITAIRIGPGNTFSRTWNTPVPATGPPVFAAGLLWSADYRFGSRMLYGLSPQDGSVVAQVQLPGVVPHFATPVSAPDRLYLAVGASLLAYTFVY